MVLDVHTIAVPTGRLARANPTAKLAACFLLGFGAALSNDALTPAVLLAFVVLALAIGGIRITHVLRRGWPLLVSAAGLGATTLLFGNSPTPWLTALTATIRVLAVALPGVVVLLTIDPTDLADSLVQNARVPARFAYASLAALRLLPLLALDWRTIKMARRARGVDAGATQSDTSSSSRARSSRCWSVLCGAPPASHSPWTHEASTQPDRVR
jgi:energy-coupling factor transport system permease protein